ncbi:MAG: myxosortase MrtP [Bradymonadaceae bacterium]
MLSALSTRLAFLSRYLYLAVAAVFIYVPLYRLDALRANLEVFGLTWRGAIRGAGWGVAAGLLTLGPYAVGYYAWHTVLGDRQAEFQWSNYLKWEQRATGRPDGAGEDPGVWLWADDHRVRLSIRAGETPVRLRLEADRPFRPDAEAAASARPTDGGRADERSAWRLDVPAGARGTVGVEPSGRGTSGYPTRLRVEALDGASIRIGGAEAPAGSSATLRRTTRWIWMWLLTHLLVVALPEEFFYRGYLQTRIRQWLRARRCEEGGPADTRSRAGLSEENALASAAFALGHLAVPVGGVFALQRASVFFPSLIFGVLRERTGTIAAPVVYHACCNMMVLLLAVHLF